MEIHALKHLPARFWHTWNYLWKLAVNRNQSAFLAVWRIFNSRHLTHLSEISRTLPPHGKLRMLTSHSFGLSPCLLCNQSFTCCVVISLELLAGTLVRVSHHPPLSTQAAHRRVSSQYFQIFVKKLKLGGIMYFRHDILTPLKKPVLRMFPVGPPKAQLYMEPSFNFLIFCYIKNGSVAGSCVNLNKIHETAFHYTNSQILAYI